jgi:AraC-like DNA-binding protein
MHYAHFLLSETDMSILEISEILSYPDQYSFSKQFKNIIGHNPSEMLH